MKHATLILCFQMLAGQVLAQHLSLKLGTPFRRSDLEVRWSLTTNPIPPTVWIYHLLPRQFPNPAISNLMPLGPFTAKDLVASNNNELLYKNPKTSTALWFSPPLGAIRFQSPTPHGPTNIPADLPKLSDLPSLTIAFLAQLGIPGGEIEKRPDGSPDLHVSEPLTIYFLDHRFITNITFRSVTLRRQVDGAPFVGNDTGGDCQIDFGDHGKPIQIMLSWRNLERFRLLPTASPETITTWIRHGKAVQGMLPMNEKPIEWRSVKSLTITAAKLCYYAGSPTEPSQWLMPFVALRATVDTGYRKTEVEIDSPIIDESKIPRATPQHPRPKRRNPTPPTSP